MNTLPELWRNGRQHAERILLANGGELGLQAGNLAYKQVWARDSMICGLGLLLCQDPEGLAIQRRSLETLRRYQSPLGKLPHNVGFAQVSDPALVAHGGKLLAESADNVPVTDTAHAGCVDNNLWYILGHYYTLVATGDLDFLTRSWASLEMALLWLRYQDSNECGLLEVHEAMDWADLFANRYNVLLDNVLYFAAWKCMGYMAGALGLAAADYFDEAREVRRKINTLLWIGPEEPKDWGAISAERKEWSYTLKRMDTELVERPFYLPYAAFRDYADRFDTLGNLAAIIFGVADRPKADKILDYIHGCGLNDPYPVRSVYPAVQPGDGDWREYYRVRNLNQPDHYHNGGAWPFLGGFYIAALVQAGRHAEAEQQLDRLTQMVRHGTCGDWEFNEWFHGRSGRPMGYPKQSWSAAMYIVAADAVENQRVRFFNREGGWELPDRG